MSVRIAICDDEEEQRGVLGKYAKQYNTKLEIELFSSAFDFLMRLNEKSFDIVFMDIEMPPPNGFEVAETVRKRENPPLIVFVTKSNTYTIQGYGIAFRYLPKPVSFEMFSTVLELAIKECEPEKIPFICDGVYHVLPINEIIYCEACDHDLTVHTRSQDYTARLSLADLTMQLPSEDFAQSHKSFLINLNYVHCVDACNVTLEKNRERILVPLSKGKRKAFIMKLGDYIGR